MLRLSARFAVPLLVASSLAAAGCGTSADRDQARTAVQRLYAAVDRGDGQTACAQMSPDLRAQLVSDEPGSRCATAVMKLSLHGGRPAAVRVYADAAEVVLAGGDTVFLGDTAEGWRVQALGCRPNGKGPYQCEEQA
jgi:outer membrane murein-binding lipoprotein Lpp